MSAKIIFKRMLFAFFINALLLRVTYAADYTIDPYNTDPSVLLAINKDEMISLTEYCSQRKSLQNLSKTDIAYLLICNNIKLKSSIEEVKVEAARHGQSLAANMPTVNLNSSYNLRNTDSFIVLNRPEFNVIGDSERSKKTGLYLSLPLFSTGATLAATKATTASLKAIVLDTQNLFESLLTESLSAYYEYYAAQALVTAYQRAQSFASQNVEISRRRATGGVASQSEVLQAEAALSRSEIDLRRAREDVQVKCSSLAALLSMSPDLIKNIRINEKEILVDDISNFVFSNDLSTLIKTRLAYVSRIAKLEAADHRLDQVQREGLMNIALTAGYANQNQKNREIISQQGIEKTVGITMSIPLFEGFSRNYKLKEAYAQRERIRYELEDIYLRLESELLLNEVTFHQERELQNFSQKYLKVANASYKAALQRYHMGLSEIIEILNAQRELTNAEVEYINSSIKFSLAKLRVDRDYGRLAEQFGFSELKFQIK